MAYQTVKANTNSSEKVTECENDEVAMTAAQVPFEDELARREETTALP